MTPEQKAALEAAQSRIAAREQDQAERGGFWDTVYENVIGRGEVDTPGERLGQYIRGGTAAVARGMADVPALPANIAQLGSAGVDLAANKLGIYEGPSRVTTGLANLPDTREMLAAVPGIGPETQYVAPGEAGQWISTIGEFGGGAGLSGGARQMLRYGVVPGVASEAAGQATEGTVYEPYARAAAALAAPFAAGKIASPFGGADPELVAAANRARQIGLNPSAGQTVGSPRLQAFEDTLSATPEQLDTLASRAMQTVGSNATRATPPALRDAEANLSQQFDDILQNVQSVPNQTIGQRALSVVDDYLQDAPANVVTPRIRNIADEIIQAATSPTPQPINLETFRKWRTALGRLVTSNDEATRDAARGLRSVIDDAVDEALIAAGRVDDIQRLADVRRQWWNLIGIKDVASRAGQEARLGRMTPEALRSAVRRTQGPDAISMGRGTDLAELALTAEAAIPSAPTVMSGGVRTMTPEAAAATAAGLGGGGITGMMAASGATAAGRQLLMNDMMQRYLRNQAVGKPTSSGMLSTLPGILSTQ